MRSASIMGVALLAFAAPTARESDPPTGGLTPAVNVCPGPTAPRRLGREDLVRLASVVGFPPGVADAMADIALRESGGRPWLVHSSRRTRDHSFGLWQINLYGSLRSRVREFGLRRPEDLLDPYNNGRAAYALWRRAGLSPWRTSDVGTE